MKMPHNALTAVTLMPRTTTACAPGHEPGGHASHASGLSVLTQDRAWELRAGDSAPNGQERGHSTSLFSSMRRMLGLDIVRRATSITILKELRADAEHYKYANGK